MQTISGNGNLLKEEQVGYHLTKIPGGTLGEFSKIKEEVLELEDALMQDCKIMALVELSDLCGAIKHFLSNHFPNFTLDDLLKMNHITERAFNNGTRRQQD